MAATDLKAKLLAPGFSPTGSTAAMSDPIADTPLVLSIDEVLPWEDNPRTTRNPRYDELKESIRNRGLDTPPACNSPARGREVPYSQRWQYSHLDLEGAVPRDQRPAVPAPPRAVPPLGPSPR